MNERLLRIPKLRVIGADGQALGVLDSRDALEAARDASLDLVLVADKADPPVAKITDFGKHKYEQSKLKKDKKPKVQNVKGIKISPNIAVHDAAVMSRRAREFLTQGDKVRLVCRFRQRELAHQDVGLKKLAAMIEELDDVGKPDRDPVLNGREMVVVLNPRPPGKTKNAQAEDKQDGGEEV
ncbi:MAG: translation initiation factor IF-3 [Fimbriimonadaceae bacterium]|nr:translation initiation factor IF-3 [Fimbriimonadaceae bacterium]